MYLNESEIPKPLCGHDKPLRYCGHCKAECPTCKSFWDLCALKSELTYDNSYPERRSHFNRLIGQNKVRSLENWIGKTRLALDGLNVCEVGFGGGFCLRYLKGFAKEVFGIEAVKENIIHAIELGASKDTLFLATETPSSLPVRIDLWIFQDSFEHLPNPGAFLRWMVLNSSPQTTVLLVAPDGSSFSEKVLGRFWPHRISDHPFHWSRRGLIEFFLRENFFLHQSFYPVKHISAQSAFSHMLIKAFPHSSVVPSKIPFPNIVFKFNLGEMGLLFKRSSHD